MAISPGATYRLKNDFGVGPGSLPAGSDVTVTGIHPPGTAGLGQISEDTVTANYAKPEGGIQTIALGVSDFAERFRKVA
jgi:hypothetical protein